MSFYPPAINKRFRSPKFTGDIADSNAAATSASFLCGAFAKVNLTIDTGSCSISDAKFHTNGCGFMIAAADVLCEWLRNKQLADLHGLAQIELQEMIEQHLEPFPLARKQCSSVVFEALRSAMAAFRKERIEEFRGESALICTCFGVSEETILNAISRDGLNTVDKVSDICRAGSGCGSCRMLIQELIDSSQV